MEYQICFYQRIFHVFLMGEKTKERKKKIREMFLWMKHFFSDDIFHFSAAASSSFSTPSCGTSFQSMTSSNTSSYQASTSSTSFSSSSSNHTSSKEKREKKTKSNAISIVISKTKHFLFSTSFTFYTPIFIFLSFFQLSDSYPFSHVCPFERCFIRSLFQSRQEPIGDSRPILIGMEWIPFEMTAQKYFLSFLYSFFTSCSSFDSDDDVGNIVDEETGKDEGKEEEKRRKRVREEKTKTAQMNQGKEIEKEKKAFSRKLLSHFNRFATELANQLNFTTHSPVDLFCIDSASHSDSPYFSSDFTTQTTNHSDFTTHSFIYSSPNFPNEFTLNSSQTHNDFTTQIQMEETNRNQEDMTTTSDWPPTESIRYGPLTPQKSIPQRGKVTASCPSLRPTISHSFPSHDVRTTSRHDVPTQYMKVALLFRLRLYVPLQHFHYVILDDKEVYLMMQILLKLYFIISSNVCFFFMNHKKFSLCYFSWIEFHQLNFQCKNTNFLL